MKSYLIIFYTFFFFVLGCNLGDFGNLGFFKTGSNAKKSELKVYENNHTFSISEIRLSLNETFSYTVSNGLKGEAFEFVLLKNGEDPILVQHLMQQNRTLSESYYIFKSEPIKPGKSKKIKFTVPSKPGRYHYVALSGSPKDSLFGTLVVESAVKKMVKKL